MIAKTILAIYVLGVFLISSFKYKEDNSDKYYVGKTHQIPYVKGTNLIIILTKIIVVPVTILSIYFDSILLLKLPSPFYLQIVGCLLLMIGVVLFIIAKKQLGQEYTPCYRSYVPKAFVRSGVYGYIRHPIYCSNMIMVFAGFCISNSVYVLVMMFALLWLYLKTTTYEEKFLSKHFEDYSAYQKITGRFFPRVFS